MKKLAIITTHPIQYNAPLFRLLAERRKIEIKVFYTWEQAKGVKYDSGFGRYVEWDISLLDGYDYTFVKNISLKPGNDFWGIINPTLNKEIIAWQANAILVFGWPFYSHLQALRYFNNRLPVYFRGDSTLLDEKLGIRSGLRSLLLNWVYKHVDSAFYVGTQNRDYFLRYGLKNNQLIWAAHTVDNRRFDDAKMEFRKNSILRRKELGILDGDLVLLFVGKLTKVKNPNLLIQVFKSISDDRLKLLFVGSGHLEEELKITARGDSRIIFLGFQNQSVMPVIYRMADILILPSSSNETWGLVVNEAMASGLPVVVSDKCGCATDLVQSGINGYIFNSQNKESLLEKIKLMCSNKDRLVIMGEAAFSCIKAWNNDLVCSTIEEEISKLL